MRAHCLMNIGFEGPGYITDWMDQHGHSMQVWRLFENPSLPDIEDVDLLVVMGGPMNIYEEERYPYLAGEKELIRACIREHKHVLGICLGAQLIADALGEKVFKNREKEIGWFTMLPDGDNEDHEILSVIPVTFTPFHWHGETFDLPEGASLLGSSGACRNQGFLYGDHVLALQFHLKTTPDSASDIISHSDEQDRPGRFVQSAKSMLDDPRKFSVANRLMVLLLDRLSGKRTGN